MLCKRAASQTCGAGQRLSLYKTVGWNPPTNPAIDGYDYFGCYSEATPSRALGDSSTRSDSMTVQMFATFCKGSAFFGLEIGNECRKLPTFKPMYDPTINVLQIVGPNSMRAVLPSLKAIVRSFVLETSRHCVAQASA